MPVPPNLNYDAWLGSTPVVPYTENRVHPQNGYGRPGWLRCEQFGAGMITGWGAHHIDSAHWGMDTEYTGPIEVWGTAEFPTKGLWDVHGPFKTEAMYANGVRMIYQRRLSRTASSSSARDGWIFVSRGNDDRDPRAIPPPSSPPTAARGQRSEDPRRRSSAPTGRLPESTDHHGNWLASIRSRQQPLAPVEVGHRACSACLLHHIAMKTKRKLPWDPRQGALPNDDDANALLSRPTCAL